VKKIRSDYRYKILVRQLKKELPHFLPNYSALHTMRTVVSQIAGPFCLPAKCSPDRIISVSI